MEQQVLVIESPDQENPWGLSFDGPNPTDEHFFPMDKETSFRLAKYLNDKSPWKDIRASGPPYKECVLYRSDDGVIYYASAKDMGITYGEYWRDTERITHYMKIPGKD